MSEAMAKAYYLINRAFNRLQHINVATKKAKQLICGFDFTLIYFNIAWDQFADLLALDVKAANRSSDLSERRLALAGTFMPHLARAAPPAAPAARRMAGRPRRYLATPPLARPD